jgi:hypothetical protein
VRIQRLVEAKDGNKFNAAATRHGYEKTTTSDRRVEATDEKIAA